jgi:hypothetical protein
MTATFVRPAVRLLAAVLLRGRRRPVLSASETPPADRAPGTPDVWLAALRLGG